MIRRIFAPQCAHIKKYEVFYQPIVEKHLKGTHKKLACGITDVTNRNTHAEIKVWNNYKSAVGQLMVYNAEDPKEHLQAYMFGKCKPTYMQLATSRMQSLGIQVFTFIDEKSRVHIIDCQTGKCVFTYKL